MQTLEQAALSGMQVISPLCSLEHTSSLLQGLHAGCFRVSNVMYMQVWAVKSYTKSVPLYIQVLQRNSLQLIAPFLDPEHDVIVSMEQTRHRLLALSCLCPGASTLIGKAMG